MLRNPLLFGTPMSTRFFAFPCSLVGLLALSVGCVEPDREDYTGPAISLSSLEEAAKQIDEADRLSFPIVVDDAEWDLKPCQATPTTRATNLSKAIPSKVDIWGLAVTTESGKALVTYLDKTEDRRSHQTAGAYCDLFSGRVLSTFDLPEFAAPFSIDPTGKHAILCRRDAIRYGRETLYLADLDQDEVVLDRWRPLVDPSIEKPIPYVDEAEIMWASFVGTDRIVTVNDAGTLHVWSFPERKRIGSLLNVSGMPSLSPDRKRVVLIVGDMLMMLDPSEVMLVGQRRIGPTPKEPVIAIHPDGKKIAVGGKGDALVYDLEYDEFFRITAQHLSADPGARLVSDFAWAGTFLHSTRHLFDFNAPMAVWELDGTRWMTPLGDSYWAVVGRSFHPKRKSKDLILRPFKIPHQDIGSRIAHVNKNVEVLALRAGDSVQIDVTGIPADRRSEIRSILQQRLAEKGFVPAKSGKVTVKAFLDPEQTFETTYCKQFTDPKKTGHTLSYRGRRGHLQIIKGNRTLWRRSGIESPPSWIKEVPADGKLDFYGEPKYTIYTEPGFPDFPARSHT